MQDYVETIKHVKMGTGRMQKKQPQNTTHLPQLCNMCEVKNLCQRLLSELCATQGEESTLRIFTPQNFQSK